MPPNMPVSPKSPFVPPVLDVGGMLPPPDPPLPPPLPSILELFPPVLLMPNVPMVPNVPLSPVPMLENVPDVMPKSPPIITCASGRLSDPVRGTREMMPDARSASAITDRTPSLRCRSLRGITDERVAQRNRRVHGVNR